MNHVEPDLLFSGDDTAGRSVTNLYPRNETAGRVIGVTSALHGEGVSTIARRLALSLSQGDGEVILVKSAQTRMAEEGGHGFSPMGIGRNPGIIDILSGSATVEQATHCCSATKLKQLTVATARGRDGAVVQHRGWLSLLQLIRKQHRWVLVDLPPVEEGVDALRVGQLLDGIILVIRANHTRAPVISRTYRAMVRCGINVHGAVLNRYEHVIPKWAYNRL